MVGELLPVVLTETLAQAVGVAEALLLTDMTLAEALGESMPLMEAVLLWLTLLVRLGLAVEEALGTALMEPLREAETLALGVTRTLEAVGNKESVERLEGVGGSVGEKLRMAVEVAVEEGRATEPLPARVALRVTVAVEAAEGLGVELAVRLGVAEPAPKEAVKLGLPVGLLVKLFRASVEEGVALCVPQVLPVGV